MTKGRGGVAVSIWNRQYRDEGSRLRPTILCDLLFPIQKKLQLVLNGWL